MHVLIVDDSNIMRQIVRRALSQTGCEGWTFAEASNGEEGMQLFHSKRPDLILSDWNMPKMDGMGLLHAIRKIDPKLPFGFITAQCSVALRKHAAEVGAHFLIAKPFSPKDLHSAIHSILHE